MTQKYFSDKPLLYTTYVDFRQEVQIRLFDVMSSMWTTNL